MNKFQLFVNRLLGRASVADFNLLGQTLTMGITTRRELRRAKGEDLESDLIDQMRLALQPNDVLFDVGANIGVVGILMAKHEAGASAQLVCFEPEPRNFSQLANNIQLNGLQDRVKCYQVALGASEGEITLHVSGTAGYGKHSIVSDSGATESVKVALSTMTKFANDEHLYPTIIKMDVEGAEGQVLAGMEGIVLSHPPRDIFMEVHTKGEGDKMPNGEPIDQWLLAHGYSLQWKAERATEEHRHYSYRK